MLLAKRGSERSHIFVYFVFIIVVCQLSKAKDYQCKPDEVQFKCQKDSKCIPKQWECDGENDCIDNSDEMNCDSCDHNKFSCDRKCISKQWLCDGHEDCNDGSDETPELCANISCDASEFRCIKSQKCISRNWVCDHEYDCEDSSDEVGCRVKPCPSSFFQCKNNACIDLNWKCDHDYDCEDQSDEVNCTYSECDTKREFQCKDRRCIQKEAFCDNQYDCKDRSDEPPSCKSTVPQKCPDDRFNCKDGSCIFRSWVCDGDLDCSSGDDEQSCQPTCPDDQMKCKNSCISKSLKCNGKPDCEDGSDESGCETVLSKCKEGQFQCTESKLCINESLVCNNDTNCDNGTDESELCGINECDDHNGGCDHHCHDKKIGYRCSCDPGYELASDMKTCQDINECKEFGKCSQNCVNFEGGRHKCSCVAGYLLDKKDHRTCKAIERHPYLVFSDNYSIRKLMLHKSEFFGIVPNLAGTIAVDYHLGENLMYWTDMKNFSIHRTTLNGSDERVVKETIIRDVRAPDGIAVDWVTGKLYWTDAWARRVEVSDLRGRNRIALIKTDIEMPRAIVLHPYSGEMFWTDWGKKPKIERCGMDGDPTSRKAIITSRIVWPNALTIDYTIDSIWWVDAKLDVIEHCDLNGGNRRVILDNDKIFHPFSISVFEDHVYWSDWSKTAIFKANKFTGQNVTLLKKGLVHTLGINMIHPQRQPASFNFCQEFNGGCSHLCLLSARYKKTHLHSCACPEGIRMLPDNRTCETADALLCEKGRCNNGTCLPGNKIRGPVCQCNEGYTGQRCESKMFKIPKKNAQNDHSNANAITIGISVGLVAVIFILFGIVCYVLYKRVQKRYNPESLKFDNPVYTKTTETIESGGSLLPFRFRKPPQEPFASDPEPLDL